MIEQDFNYAYSTVKYMADFIETRVEDSDSSVMELSEEQLNKQCILHGKCRHSIDKCKDLHIKINKHKQKKKGSLSLMERGTMN